MPLLPTDPFALLGIAVIVVGLVAILKPDVPKAYGLAVVILLVMAVQTASAIFSSGIATYALGLQTDTLLDGKWWPLLTGMFAHSDLLHLFGNLFILTTAGPALEERIGDRRFLVIFFLAGLAGFAAHVVLSFVVPDVVPRSTTVLGASGAIFGVLTTFAVRYPKSRLPITLPGIFFILWMPAFVVLLIYLAFNLVYLLSDAMGAATGIAWWGHFGGFLVGLPFAYTLPPTHESVRGGTRGLPDPEKLEPLATTPELRRLLDRVRQFNPDARTQHDSEFAMAWVDRFLDNARCPACGGTFRRENTTALCSGGETRVDFGRR